MRTHSIKVMVQITTIVQPLRRKDARVLKFVGHSYKLERALKNPLDTASQFYLSGETDQTYAEESVELMRWIEDLEVGSKIYLGGIIDFHF